MNKDAIIEKQRILLLQYEQVCPELLSPQYRLFIEERNEILALESTGESTESKENFATYTLNCDKCGTPYTSAEAFPEDQLCDKCFGIKYITLQPEHGEGTGSKKKRDPHNDIYGPGDDNYGRDKKFWDKTDEEWLKLPKEEILQLYKMLQNYIGLSGEKIVDIATFTLTEFAQSTQGKEIGDEKIEKASEIEIDPGVKTDFHTGKDITALRRRMWSYGAQWYRSRLVLQKVK